MTASALLLVVVGLAAVAYALGRSRAWAVAGQSGGIRAMNSLPSHHGELVALWCALPALAIVIVWQLAQPLVIDRVVHDTVPSAIGERGERAVALYRNEVENLVANGGASNIDDPDKRRLGERLTGIRATGNAAANQ